MGVYDPKIVGQIEAAKKEGQTWTNDLKIALLFKELSIGPKCYFCNGKAGQLALDYFKSAVNKTSTKADLERVFFGYTGDFSDNGEKISEEDLHKRFLELPKCFSEGKKDDILLQCESEAYEGFNFSELSTHSFDSNGSNINNFLMLIANKMRPFDAEYASAIEIYLRDINKVKDYIGEKYEGEQKNNQILQITQAYKRKKDEEYQKTTQKMIDKKISPLPKTQSSLDLEMTPYFVFFISILGILVYIRQKQKRKQKIERESSEYKEEIESVPISDNK